MKKKQELTIEEMLVQTYVSSYQFEHKNRLDSIDLYDYKYKVLQHKIIEHKENEPSKIFKKAHKNWLIKKDKLDIELENSFNNLIKEYIKLEKFNESFNK